MLKDRVLQVSMAKKPLDSEGKPVPQTEPQTIAHVNIAMKEVMSGATRLVATYLVLDTARKVILTLVEKK